MSQAAARWPLLAFGAASMGAQIVTASASAFLPPQLELLGAGPLLIGVLLALDPLGGVLVQPFMNVMSDRARSRWGRRVPFIAIGTLVTCLGLVAISMASSLPAVVAAIVLTFVGYNIWVGPYRASLGEIFPPALYSLATGFQTLFRGVGLLLAFTAGTWLFTRGTGWPFILASAVVLVSALWTSSLLVTRAGNAPARSSPYGELWSFLRGSRDLRWLLAGQFGWWFALYSMVGFTVLYGAHEVAGVQDLGTALGKAATANATGYLAVYSLTGLVLALPVGWLAQRLGKKPVLAIGLLFCGAGLALAATVPTAGSMWLMALGCGVGFACAQVIPYTMLLEIQPKGHEGALVAVFSLFVNLPQITCLALGGWLAELTGSYRLPFGLAAVAALVSLGCALCVRLPSETAPSQVEHAA